MAFTVRRALSYSLTSDNLAGPDGMRPFLDVESRFDVLDTERALCSGIAVSMLDVS
jgi:hypothetical protein